MILISTLLRYTFFSTALRSGEVFRLRLPKGKNQNLDGHPKQMIIPDAVNVLL